MLQSEPMNTDSSFYACNRCGNFTVSRTAIRKLQVINNSNDRAKISHVIRQANENNQDISIHTELINEILKRPLPTPSEQADTLIRWLGEHIDDPGKAVQFTKETGVAIIGASSTQGFNWILHHLSEKKLIGKISITGNSSQVKLNLTFDGWQHFGQLKMSGKSYRKAFMAMKFGEEALNWILENVFKPSVAQTGFQLYKLDDQPRAGLIDDRLRVEIQSSDFLIADLTHGNFGAYWEAGYAEGLGKPVIYTCEKKKFYDGKTHFDTNHHLTIFWEEQTVEPTKEQLKATIRATLPSIAKMSD